jgi:alanyl-tRNA synthetase
MTVIKRSQLAIISFIFMIAIAGYINYKYNPEREKNLGQTVYVNGKDSYTYGDIDIYSNENSKIQQNALEKTDDSIAVFRRDRDNMFSELSENYSNIISNKSTNVDTINVYQKKLNELIEQKNLITMVENVIKSKGIEDIVIIPTSNNNINVVIKSTEDLKSEQMAQIQQILVDQLGASPNKLSISCKRV